MKKTLSVAVLVCLFFAFQFAALNAKAQQYKIQMGNSLKDKVQPTGIIGRDNAGNIYALGGKSHLTYLVPLLLFNAYHIDIP